MRAIGIILAGGNNLKMQELSNKRAIAAMPIAGSYRAIDFALSSMSNSHVQIYSISARSTQFTRGISPSQSGWWSRVCAMS